MPLPLPSTSWFIMIIHWISAANARVINAPQPSLKREMYPLDFITDEQVIPWRANSGWAYPTFLGFGQRDGHKTVKVRFTEGSTRQKVFIEFFADQRISQLALVRDKNEYMMAIGGSSIADVINANSSVNGNALGSYVAGVWKTGNISTKRVGKFFEVSIGNTPSYPVNVEFYLIDDMTTF